MFVAKMPEIAEMIDEKFEKYAAKMDAKFDSLRELIISNNGQVKMKEKPTKQQIID